jgi:SAM-dependent methyltransferase
MRFLPVSLFSKLASCFYDEILTGEMQRVLDPAVGLKLLDAPCGTGILRDICKPAEYHGVDLDEPRVRAARARDLERDLKLVVGDISRLGFRSASFDRILASGLLHHVGDSTALQILDEFARVLKPEGRLVVLDAIWPYHWYNLVGLVARALDEGRFVRRPETYLAFFAGRFDIVSITYPSRLGLEYILALLKTPAASGGTGRC